jgi:RNA polymerase sigma factor (sigma-70 family)
MERFDIEDMGIGEEGEVAGQPDEPAGGAPSARPSLKDIYTRYQGVVRRRLKRRNIEPAVAEEIHQEVFLTLAKLIQENRLTDNPLATLRTITGHLICNHLRTRERRPAFADDVELDALPASQPDVEQWASRAERKRIVEAILAELPGNAAALIQTIDLGVLTYEDIAWFFDVPISTVRTQHFRAREKFRDLLKRHYPMDLGGGA